MSEERRPVPVQSGDTSAVVTWLQDVARQVRLAWRLFRDQRVPLWTKLIPPVALAYVFFPVDIIPDVALGLGQLDDIAVLLLGIKLFVELSPPDVVREHLRALGARVQEWRVVGGEEEKKDDHVSSSSIVLEGEYALRESEDSPPDPESV
jgi:uncharacterized membrane protein YkvA (DUF1232 family)